jgi:hypothetical protein
MFRYTYEQYQVDAIERQKKAQKAEVAKQIHQENERPKRRRY